MPSNINESSFRRLKKVNKFVIYKTQSNKWKTFHIKKNHFYVFIYFILHF